MSEASLPLSLEAYARLLAHVACRRGVRLAEILAELGIEQEALHAAEVALREQLAGVLQHRSGMAAMKFTSALGAELGLLGPIGGDGSTPPPPEIVPILADAPEVRDTEMPSYLQGPPPHARGGAVEPHVFRAVPAVTRVPEPPPMVRAQQASASPLAGTANVDMSAIVAAVQHGALPFAHPEAAPASVAEVSEEAPAAQRRSPSVGTGTVGVDVNAPMTVERGLLPFARSETPGPGAAEGGDDSDLSLLPLETYASVSGALARGESREATLKRCGLTVEAFEILARAWAQRFQREPNLLEKFKELARSSVAAGRRGEGQR
jgi:hypothetical protein